MFLAEYDREHNSAAIRVEPFGERGDLRSSDDDALGTRPD
jgi:hypothetical protein